METKYVTKKQISILILLFLFLSTSLFSQSKPSIYLMFKENSKELCDVHLTRAGSFHTIEDVRKYAKIEQKNGDLVFYICNEKFIHEKKAMKRHIAPKNFFDKNKLTEYEDLVDFLNKMQDKYPMGYKYPSNEYPKIYVPIDLPDSQICLYEVKWQYYIE